MFWILHERCLSAAGALYLIYSIQITYRLGSQSLYGVRRFLLRDISVYSGFYPQTHRVYHA
jgi:hypothetical protein